MTQEISIKEIRELIALNEAMVKAGATYFDGIPLGMANALMQHYDALEAKLNDCENRTFVTVTDLEKENAKLREALQPFANKWERVRKPYDNGATWTGNFPYAPHKAAWEALKGDKE